MNRRPDFIVMGAMKSATSTLHEQLSEQEGFFMTEVKEPNFFSNDEFYARGCRGMPRCSRTPLRTTSVANPARITPSCPRILTPWLG